jgi:cation channel sperm-associated protein 2
MALIVINSVSIGVQGELPLSDHPGMVVLREFLNFIDAFTVIVFSLEILLKWTDNFSAFWRDAWNVFDLIVTVLSAVPLAVQPFIGSGTSGVAVVEQLAVFRILRALKMVARFGRLRIIVLTILKAIKSMVFITILLFAVAYIFAIVGVVFFESYSIPDRPDLNYHHSFSSLPRALLTLFQLFTLDQWVEIHSDLVEVSNQAFTSTYILLWVWVGAFLFRNLFVGIMGRKNNNNSFWASEGSS